MAHSNTFITESVGVAKRRILPLILLVGLTMGGSDALADVCRTLEANFHKAVQQAADPVAAARYASAVAQQNLELRRVRQDQRRLRCLNSSIIQVRPDGGSDCGDIAKSIDRMEENLSILTAKLKELRGQPTREQRIDELVANGCSLEGIETDEQNVRTPYLDTVPEVDRASKNLGQFEKPRLLPTGNVRTLCVRTCDGGFFPISSQSSATYFERDATLCQNMCPGVKTELFYQPPLQGDAADMISVATGQSYRDLPSAFAYRSRGRDESCSCNFSSNRGSGAGIAKQAEPQTSIRQLSAPSVSLQNKSIPAPERDLDEAALGARKVGPVFLPPDKGTINLRNPAQPGPQPLQE
ncbi:DUF2865 domain-containing protein [Rhizobium sp. G187]|uniref:DUF2865 domain-containing protein n=1 Tax=Rhizobium sp. G187 TaxID=3451352 RepID=UPI003EE7C1F3